MYKKQTASKGIIKANSCYKGERIEQKINRIVNNKEPIKDGAPQIYTDRKDGVNPQHDIRTDRFEIALDATTAIDKSHKAKREFGIGERTFDTMTTEQQKAHIEKYPNSKHKQETGGQSTQGTDNK